MWPSFMHHCISVNYNIQVQVREVGGWMVKWLKNPKTVRSFATSYSVESRVLWLAIWLTCTLELGYWNFTAHVSKSVILCIRPSIKGPCWRYGVKDQFQKLDEIPFKMSHSRSSWLEKLTSPQGFENWNKKNLVLRIMRLKFREHEKWKISSAGSASEERYFGP